MPARKNGGHVGSRKGSGQPPKGGEQSQGASEETRLEYIRNKMKDKRKQESPALLQKERYPLG